MKGIFTDKIALIVIGVLVASGIGYGAYTLTRTNGDDPSTNTGSQSESTVDVENNTTATTSGDQVVEGGLVEGFPGDKIPLYLGDVVESSRSADSYGKTEFNVTIQTNDSFERVDDWTRTSYVNEGWDIRTENKTLLGGTMIIAHSDTYINTITYDEQEGGIIINYGISEK